MRDERIIVPKDGPVDLVSAEWSVCVEVGAGAGAEGLFYLVNNSKKRGGERERLLCEIPSPNNTRTAHPKYTPRDHPTPKPNTCCTKDGPICPSLDVPLELCRLCHFREIAYK